MHVDVGVMCENVVLRGRDLCHGFGAAGRSLGRDVLKSPENAIISSTCPGAPPSGRVASASLLPAHASLWSAVPPLGFAPLFSSTGGSTVSSLSNLQFMKLPASCPFGFMNLMQQVGRDVVMSGLRSGKLLGRWVCGFMDSMRLIGRDFRVAFGIWAEFGFEVGFDLWAGSGCGGRCGILSLQRNRGVF